MLSRHLAPRLPTVLLAALLAVSLLPDAAEARKKTRGAEPATADYLRDAASRLLGEALLTDQAWTNLSYLCDQIGNRLSGSPALARAVEWSRIQMEKEGLTNARTEEVMVPQWIRGEESLRMLAPLDRELPMLGLGNSVGTPPEGITAEVVVVSSWDELTALGDAVRGKIVLYDVPFTTYSETVQYRGGGANEASKLGAVAALVRSVTPVSLSTPHTGALRYREDEKQLPAAAITVEDAQTLHRLQDAGVPIRLTLKMQAKFGEDVPSHNVLADVPGRELPNEVVVVGCHLDSWDVGQGAQDDGAGCIVAMEAARLISRLERKPRRTVRVVLYTNEENGLRGGAAYAEAHPDGEEVHIAAIESDTGAGKPLGFRVDVRGPKPEGGERQEADEAGTAAALEHLQVAVPFLEPIGATLLEGGYSGADIGPLAANGALALGLKHDMTGYWPIHHTEADTIDKIDPQNLRKNVAAMALMALVLAELGDGE